MIAALVLLVLVAGPAQAHGTLPGGGGFQAGALHPLAATEHLLALIAAGMMLGRAGGQAVPIGLGALVAGLGAGLAVAPPPAPAPFMIPGLTLLCGLALALGRGVPAPLAALPLLPLGWAIAADTDLPASEGWAAAAGLAVAAGLILLNFAALAQAAGVRWPLAPRIAGSWVFAVALLVLTLNLGAATGPLAGLP